MSTTSENVCLAEKELTAPGSLWSAKLSGSVTICLVLTATTLAAYWPVRTHDFVTFDDPSYVTGNPHVVTGLKWPNVVWAFQTSQSCSWQPLAWLSHILDCHIFG